MILVCFAVKEEAGPFKKAAVARPGVKVLLTGIGRRNAGKTVRAALTAHRPSHVLTCGFAGGLRPDLETGSVLFSAASDTLLANALTAAGARPGRFHSVHKVVASAAEKQNLFHSTGADAIEMESEEIAAASRESSIPCAIVRVILDPSNEDLPLDFSALLNADDRMDYAKLAVAVMKSPGKISALRRLQKQSKLAGERLAEVVINAVEKLG